MSMTLEEAIIHAEKIAEVELDARSYALEWRDNEEAGKCQKCADEHRQLAEWLKILKKAKFEYDEAWRTITHPTPDVTYADRNRAQMILDTFRGSLGKLDAERKTYV